MIIVKLQGGLGNQMFQYALGRRLSSDNMNELKLDTSFLLIRPQEGSYTFRNFELDAFNIKPNIATKKEVRKFIGNSFISRLRRMSGLNKLIFESTLEFRPEVLRSGANVYFDGYWQSEKYFANIRTELLSEFTPVKSRLEILNKNKLLKIVKELIEKTNSVSVHFRRGDYVSNEVINNFHGTCSIQYYMDAINLIAQRIQSPHFFLFSDEHEWLKGKSFTGNFPSTIVSSNDNNLDLYLMSLCKHNIIANSSFSWWGAWLNRNPEKMVIAPERWFTKVELNQQTKDLIPPTWIRI